MHSRQCLNESRLVPIGGGNTGFLIVEINAWGRGSIAYFVSIEKKGKLHTSLNPDVATIFSTLESAEQKIKLCRFFYPHHKFTIVNK